MGVAGGGSLPSRGTCHGGKGLGAEGNLRAMRAVCAAQGCAQHMVLPGERGAIPILPVLGWKQHSQKSRAALACAPSSKESIASALPVG